MISSFAGGLVERAVTSLVDGLVAGVAALAAMMWGDTTAVTWGDGTDVEWSGS